MHRAEQILDAVLTALTGLTTTDARVERSRVRSVETTPALTISMGSDDVVLERSSYPKLERELNVRVNIYVENNTNPEAQMNLIREEVFAAMMANPKWGLTYVVDTMSSGDEEPEFTGDSAKIMVKQQMNFIIYYRHSWTNAGV